MHRTRLSLSLSVNAFGYFSLLDFNCPRVVLSVAVALPSIHVCMLSIIHRKIILYAHKKKLVLTAGSPTESEGVFTDREQEI